MAVYTQVDADDIANFLTDYDVGNIISFKGIAEGVENSNYLLQTDQNHFILTLYEKRVNPDDLPFFLNLMDHLAQKGLNCATPVRDRQGQALKELCGRPAALISFLQGMSINKPTPHHCRQLGQALAQMHNATADFKMTRVNNLSVDGWQNLMDQCIDRADNVIPGLSGILQTEMKWLGDHWPEHLPSGVIHADLFPDNVFFRGDTLSGLIDFYFACTDILAYDLAICLNAWCFETDGSFNITKARNLTRGYHNVRPLSTAEYDSLPLLCRGAAMRFLLTRLYDWLHQVEGATVTVKNPREYLEKLTFHQAITSASAYGLE
ncbi:MAG: homoserine kinase [Kordiimonas sp.]|nr:homoserine kinase [Kordiimonas sp.]|tara:strand:- start:1122 stop:2084 length:963 start_codon:yes stop_codon:yes gene_type:complete